MRKPAPGQSCPSCGGAAGDGMPVAWPSDQPELRGPRQRAEREDASAPRTRRHRYGADLQRILRRFYRAGGIELSFDPHGHLTGLTSGTGRPPAATCSHSGHVFCSGPCDCARQGISCVPGTSTPKHSRRER
jgi:hypothetical protein